MLTIGDTRKWVKRLVVLEDTTRLDLATCGGSLHGRRGGASGGRGYWAAGAWGETQPLLLVAAACVERGEGRREKREEGVTACLQCLGFRGS